MGWSHRSERGFMMNHDGWMGGMGGGMWLWAVLITVLVVVMLVVLVNRRSNK